MYTKDKNVLKKILIIICIQILICMTTITAEADDEPASVVAFSKLKIGAYVAYKTDKTENDKYIFQGKYTGTEEDQDWNYENISTWRIFSINESEGTVDLISGKTNSNIISLKGAQGYNNGVYLLNEACRTLYGNESIGAVARSLSELDIVNNYKSDSVYKDYVERNDNNEVIYEYGEIVNYEKRGCYPTQWVNDFSERYSNLIEVLSKDRNLIEPENQVGGSYADPITSFSSYYLLSEDEFADAFKDLPEGDTIRNSSSSNVFSEMILYGDDNSLEESWLASRYVYNKNVDSRVAFGLVSCKSTINRVTFGGSENWWTGTSSKKIRPIVTVPISAIDTEAAGRDGTKGRPLKLVGDDDNISILLSDNNLYNTIKEQLNEKNIDFKAIDAENTINISEEEISKVQKLELNNKDIENIIGIEGFYALKELNLNNNKLKGNIETLSNLTNLEVLKIRGNEITDLTSISNLTNLKVLDVSKNKLFDSEEIKITKELELLVNLEELGISHNYIIYTEGLEKLKKLKKLNMYDNAVHNLSGLMGLNKLEVLNLGMNNENKTGDIENLNALETLVSLQELDFSKNYTQNIMDYIYELTDLKKLDLSMNSLEDSAIQDKISYLINLEELNLYLNSLSDITPFLTLNKLKNFDIQRNSFSSFAGILTNENELVWPNIEKFGIYRNYSLYVGSSEIQYLINRSREGTLELNYDKITDTTNLPHTDENSEIKYVTYEDFGARCNGEYDDYIAIRNAHNFANKNNCEVRGVEGKTYHIFKYNEAEVTIKTNVDWNNANIVIHDEDIEDKNTRYNRIFMVTNINEDDIITIEKPAWTIGKQTKKITNISNALSLLEEKGYHKCLCYVENEYKRQFMRYGHSGNTGYTQRDCFTIDMEGNVLNDIIWDFSQISSIKILPIPNEKTYIKNGNFITNSLSTLSETMQNRPTGKSTVYYTRNILFQNCANMEISNINHDISIDEICGSYYGFIALDTCADIDLKDSHLVARKYASSGRSTYDLTFHSVVNFKCTNITQDNIFDDNRWGIIGSKFSKDVVFENCTLDRIDAHEGIYNLTVKDCYLGRYGIVVVGFGTINAINTVFEGNVMVQLRSDYGTFWNGDVNIIDCTYKYHSEYAWSLFGVNVKAIAEGFDFGYDVMLPNIYIENLTLDNVNSPDESEFYIFPIWSAQNPNVIPESYWPKSFYLNGFKFINSNISDPKMRILAIDIPKMNGNYVITNTKLKSSSGEDLTNQFNKGYRVVADKDITLEIKEEPTAVNKVSLYKDGVRIVNQEEVKDIYQYIFNENGTYKIVLNSTDYKYGKTGEKEYEFEISKEAKEDYTILEGANQRIIKGKDLVIKASGNIDKFKELRLDSKLLSKEYYSIKSGSTIATIKGSYIENLSIGEHTITFVYLDGTVTTKFKIEKSEDENSQNDEEENNQDESKDEEKQNDNKENQNERVDKENTDNSNNNEQKIIENSDTKNSNNQVITRIINNEYYDVAQSDGVTIIRTSESSTGSTSSTNTSANKNVNTGDLAFAICYYLLLTVLILNVGITIYIDKKK